MRPFIDVFPRKTFRLMAIDSYWLTQLAGVVTAAPLV